MKKKKIVIIVGVICGILNWSYHYCSNYYNTKCVSGNNLNEIKCSIIYLHEDYIDEIKDIKIIDEFVYENEKVVFFTNEDLTGYAKFNKDSEGNYKIVFVETVDSNSTRNVSKIL